jgi:hypothetical protein
MLSKFARSRIITRAQTRSLFPVSSRALSGLGDDYYGAGPVSLDGYGKHLFKGATAAPYLEKQGLPKNALDSPSWTTNGTADKVYFHYFFLYLVLLHVFLSSFRLLQLFWSGRKITELLCIAIGFSH